MSGPRVVVVSDLHAHQHAQFATTLPGGRNSRLQSILDVVDEITAFVDEFKADALFFLGDMFHSRTKVDVDVFSATWTCWKRLCAKVEHAYILVGNHDQYNKVGSIHSLEPFREFATVVDRPIIERAGPIRFAAHPFTTDIEEWHAFVAMLPNDLDFFLFHQGLCEAATGAFDISIKAEVNYADLPHGKARWILGGHYHKPQWLGPGEPEERNVAYVGSPLQHSFNERTETKGFLAFDGLESRPRFVETSAPRFHLYESATEFFDHYSSDASAPYAPWNCGDYIRVRCHQKDGEAISREFPHIQIEIQQTAQQEERRIDEASLQSDKKLLESYITEASRNGLDNERLLKMGLELITEAEE